MQSFVLIIYWRNGQRQVRNCDNLVRAMDEVAKLRPSLVKGYELHAVLHSHQFQDIGRP